METVEYVSDPDRTISMDRAIETWRTSLRYGGIPVTLDRLSHANNELSYQHMDKIAGLCEQGSDRRAIKQAEVERDIQMNKLADMHCDHFYLDYIGHGEDKDSYSD